MSQLVRESGTKQRAILIQIYKIICVRVLAGNAGITKKTNNKHGQCILQFRPALQPKSSFASGADDMSKIQQRTILTLKLKA